MRTIKFRAWDTVDHEWYKKINPPARMVYFGNPKVFDDGWLQFDCIGQDPIGDSGEDRHILMLYTGLKDKNSKEIYEGDIVKHRNGIQVVEWDDASYSFQMGLSNHVLDQEVGNDDAIEVIGNIYENPELLKIDPERSS